MSSFDEFEFVPETFGGVARLFPLPNLVLFPHVMQPLHIFEPRYRLMLEDALASDQLITMATLAPGWESDYEGRPKLEPVGCLCRVASHHRTEAGTYNILVVGLRRVELLEEVGLEKPFREARVRVVDDDYPGVGSFGKDRLQSELLTAFKNVLPRVPDTQDQLEHLLAREIPLGMLTDIVSFTVALDVATKLKLLGECNVRERAVLLLQSLASLRGQSGPMKSAFPPDFSVN